MEEKQGVTSKGFDSAWILEKLDARGGQVVISPHPRRIECRSIDAELYKWRHLIENFFGKLKGFKRIALRACKTDTSFAAMIYTTAAFLNSDEFQQTLVDRIRHSEPSRMPRPV